jgi:hypothetical protein
MPIEPFFTADLSSSALVLPAFADASVGSAASKTIAANNILPVFLNIGKTPFGSWLPSSEEEKAL